ncbi:MAG: hypothetical protein WC516_09745 [Patescibacteria group bacterium]|jgi:transposase-like protein
MSYQCYCPKCKAYRGNKLDGRKFTTQLLLKKEFTCKKCKGGMKLKKR